MCKKLGFLLPILKRVSEESETEFGWGTHPRFRWGIRMQIVFPFDWCGTFSQKQFVSTITLDQTLPVYKTPRPLALRRPPLGSFTFRGSPYLNIHIRWVQSPTLPPPLPFIVTERHRRSALTKSGRVSFISFTIRGLWGRNTFCDGPRCYSQRNSNDLGFAR